MIEAVAINAAGDAETSSDAQGNDGVVLTFVSAKGGTGKTVLVSSTAYLLLKSGKKVLLIDTDFSTRGLSLYTLGSAMYATGFRPKPEECLADFVLEKRNVEKVRPRCIDKDGAQYRIILSNQALWRSSVPDADIFTHGETSGDLYLERLRELLGFFRSQYDYIIVDTRGGYDVTSAVPALLADLYVVVLEADKVSLDQVASFDAAIEAFASGREIRRPIFGFVVNKATFDPARSDFAEELARSYGAKTFGIIPADLDCIRAYADKGNPIDRFPYSDFANWAAEMVRNLVAPQLNWSDTENVKQFEQRAGQIHREWAARKRLDRILSWLPFAQLVLIALAGGLYVLYRLEPSAALLFATYGCAVGFVLWSMMGTTLAGLQRLRRIGVGQSTRRWIGSGAGAIMIILGALMFTDVPRNLLVISLPPQAVSLNESASQDISDIAGTSDELISAWQSLAVAVLDVYADRVQEWAEAVVRNKANIPINEALSKGDERSVNTLTAQAMAEARVEIEHAAESARRLLGEQVRLLKDKNDLVTRIMEAPRESVDYRADLLERAPRLVEGFESVDKILERVQERLLRDVAPSGVQLR